MRIFIIITIAIIGFTSFRTNTDAGPDDKYLSPTHLTADKASKRIYVSLSTAEKIAVINMEARLTESYIMLPFNPGGIALSNTTGSLFVADRKAEGKVHQVALLDGRIVRSYSVGHTPDALAITPDNELVVVANRFSNTVSVIDVVNNRIAGQIEVDREPKAIAISDDGKYIAVANNIPSSASTEDHISAKITLIDRKTLEVIANCELANGSHSIEGIVFSKDGKFLYASHILSRNHLPTTQLKHGWMNTNALSILDIETKSYLTTVLLDSFNHGAANPAGMAVSDNGEILYIALSGVHELSVIDLTLLHKKLDLAKNNDFRNMAVRDFSDIPNDLMFLTGLNNRIPLSGKSPRYVLAADNKIWVSSYFSSEIECIAESGISETGMLISLGNQPAMNSIRRGELFFCDADLCFQNWQSCITCHPGARADGLNWDLMNDGIGNPKNTKSMLYAHFTPPAMVTGIRENAEIAVRAGIKLIQFSNRPEKDASDIDAYLSSLVPVESPYLIKGKLSDPAIKGKLIFERAGCHICHSGEYFTDGNKYDVGTGISPHLNDLFDTPTLIETWRTAPYLYDGRAKTMREVFSKYNSGDKHGYTSGLSDDELNSLCEYILSL
jgi:YVTN family beta-propeller protein